MVVIPSTAGRVACCSFMLENVEKCRKQSINIDCYYAQFQVHFVCELWDLTGVF